ncbi:MAG: N-acetyl-alpha-D-glucosaminyl L-malate synthase BshA [Bacteroidia bacterium]|nr:N-acetyl-alpha-D-glucosaminyl L-malate synthase BshA [Bacteroidia bacterium]
MNIGIVCYPTFGGSGVVATELGKALADKGHFVHFISYNQPARLDTFTENIFYHEVIINKYPLFAHAPYETALAGKMIDIVKAEHLDILHVHYAIPHASAALMAKQILKDEGIDIPVITTLHGTDITLVGRERTFADVVSWSINNSDSVTAVSESLKQDTLEHFNINREIDVVPNFIDFNRFNKKPRDHFKTAIAPGGEKLLVHTSNFRKVKRVEDVVEVFAKVFPSIPSKLLLIGDGPERSNIEQKCRELSMCDQIIFMGKQEAVEEILSVCDLFILPSEKESFGLSALEAMACEVPVISSNTGGLPEVNIHGETGFMAEVGDTDTMAKFALELLTNEAKLTQFKETALLHAESFALLKVLEQYLVIYNRHLK